MLATISDLMFVPHMVVAFTVSVAILRYLDLLPPRRPWIVAGTAWGSVAAGVVLVRACFDTAALGSQAGLSIDRSTAALNTYAKGFLLQSAGENWLHLTAAFWVVSSLVLILYLVRRHVVHRAQLARCPNRRGGLRSLCFSWRSRRWAARSALSSWGSPASPS